MRRTFSRAAGAVVAMIVAGAASAASASAGSGIRLGGTDGRLHPFLDYETRYDSNVTYGDSGAVGDVVLHVRPGLELKVPGEIAVVEFSGAVDWAQYTKETNLSKMYADAGLAALLNPRGAVSIRIDDDFRRQVSASSLALAQAVIANSNTLTLSLPWKPGGGALVLTARGQWLLESYQSFEKSTPTTLPMNESVADLGYNEFRGGLDVQWKFLPRTSASFHGGYFSRLPSKSGRPDDTSGVDFTAGVNGLVTPHVGVSLKAGYGGTFKSGSSFSTFLADVGAEWLPTEGASLRVGYSRAFGLDPSVSVFGTNSVYGTGRIRVAQRYSLRTTVRYDHLSFDQIPPCTVLLGTSTVCAAAPAGTTTGTTAFVRVEPGIDATITRWMSATLAYAYSSRASDFPTYVGVGDYSKNEAWLKLGFTY